MSLTSILKRGINPLKAFKQSLHPTEALKESWSPLTDDILGMNKPNATALALQAQNKLAQQQTLLSSNSDTSNVTQFSDDTTSDFSSSSDNRRKKPTSGYGVSLLSV